MIILAIGFDLSLNDESNMILGELLTDLNVTHFDEDMTTRLLQMISNYLSFLNYYIILGQFKFRMNKLNCGFKPLKKTYIFSTNLNYFYFQMYKCVAFNSKLDAFKIFYVCWSYLKKN